MLQCNPSARTYRMSNELYSYMVLDRLHASAASERNKKIKIELKTDVFNSGWNEKSVTISTFDFRFNQIHRVLFPTE